MTAGRIADHTNQNRITLGGNVCGCIIYRETVLPLLLAEAKVFIFDGNTEIEKDFNEIFNKRINIKDNEIVTKFVIDTKYLNMPYAHIKKTKSDKIDYPLLTVVAINGNNHLKIAFSGLTSFPFRSKEVENILNNNLLTRQEKVNKIIVNLPENAMDNIDGSKTYREFVLKNTIDKILDIFNR